MTMATFRTLPPEIRDEIYDLVILSNHLVYQQDCAAHLNDGSKRSGFMLLRYSYWPVNALLRIDKLISDEYIQRLAALTRRVPFHVDMAVVSNAPFSYDILSWIPWVDANWTLESIGRDVVVPQKVKDLVKTFTINILVCTPVVVAEDLGFYSLFRQMNFDDTLVVFEEYSRHALATSCNATWLIDTPLNGHAFVREVKRIASNRLLIEKMLGDADGFDIFNGSIELVDKGTNYSWVGKSLEGMRKMVKQVAFQSPGSGLHFHLVWRRTSQYQPIENPRPNEARMHEVSQQVEEF